MSYTQISFAPTFHIFVDPSMEVWDAEEVIQDIFLIVIFGPNMLLMYSQTLSSHNSWQAFPSLHSVLTQMLIYLINFLNISLM